jgi:hypothetical protein
MRKINQYDILFMVLWMCICLYILERGGGIENSIFVWHVKLRGRGEGIWKILFCFVFVCWIIVVCGV